MASNNPQGKRKLIQTANSTAVAVTGVAAFVVVFVLVASKLLVSQLGYQQRVINAKSAALKQLKDDASAAHDLISSYQGFVGTPQNIIGGNPAGSGSQDGNNANIVLAALPASYDFPALAASLQKILTGQTTQSPSINVKINSIAGSDDELSQGTTSTGNPMPVPMPFQISVTGDYTNIQNLITVLERSIRPFQIQTLQLSGSQSTMTLTLTAQTYYQPATTFTLNTKVVR